MRQPTEQEAKDYKYIVSFKIDVKRTDNQMLTDDENAMVDKMRVATEAAVAKVMANYGQDNSKHLGSQKVVY